MKNILDMNVEELAGYSFDCECGRRHSVGIHQILIGPGSSQRIPSLLEKYKEGTVYVVADETTYAVLGEKIERMLKAGGYHVKSFVCKATGALVPDEAVIGRLVIELPRDTSFIIAVGSGTINDICREISCKMQIPYLIAGTAPSMDGYASTVSPLIVEKYKKTFEAVYPRAIVADTEIMKIAPMVMIRAGIGDILGKYTALMDWALAKELNKEYYCPTIVALVRRAVNQCVDTLESIVSRDGDAIKYLIEALILSGIAIGMVGNSRPASGSEHHFSHYWEIDAIQHGREHPLHGNSVGVGCVISSTIYKLMKDKLPKACVPPEPELIESLLLRAGACVNPKELGISRELFHRSVIHAREVRPRFTILQFAAQYGRLEEFADIITEKYYG